MTTQFPWQERAKQGDPDAIAALMNQTLKQQAQVRVRRQGGQYKILMEAAKVPNQSTTVQWILQGLAKLAIPDIQTVTIYGKAQQNAKPTWRQIVDFAVEPNSVAEPQPSPSAGSVLPPADGGPANPSDTAEPRLDLTAYCFTRNKSLLSGKLTPPSSTVTQLVLSFASLANPQKLEVLPHVETALRKPKQLQLESLGPEAQSWLEQLLALDGTDIRKLSIWLSRYCADPQATSEQLESATTPPTPAPEPEKNDAAPPHPEPAPTNRPTQSQTNLSHQAAAHSRATSPRAERSDPTANRVMFAKGTAMPAWAIPTGWIICLLMMIGLGVRSAAGIEYSYPICAETSGSSAACMLAVQMAYGEEPIAEAIEQAAPMTPEVKASALEYCSEYAYSNISSPPPMGTSWRPNRSEAVEIVSSQTEEIFPGVLVTDLTQIDQHAEGAKVRVACVDYAYQYDQADGWPSEIVGQTGLMDIAADQIPLNWPEEPYSEILDISLSTAKALGVYNVFISLGANTLFTAIGVLIAVLTSSCYICYTMQGIYKTAFVLGLIETGLSMIPILGWLTIPMEVMAVGLTSMVVKEFKVHWTEGYRPLAIGAMTIVIIRMIFNILLYTSITHFMMP